MTLLATLVGTSQRVGIASARRTKVRELASFLEALPPDEIETAVHYLSGEISQGGSGSAYRAVRAAAATGAPNDEVLSITEVDRSLAAIDGIRGAGSVARRAEALRSLFSRATSAEQEFLLRLVVGELRQGALAGVTIVAVAAAAGVPVTEVRRATMYSKSLGAVARAALMDAAETLAKCQLELFLPPGPC